MDERFTITAHISVAVADYREDCAEDARQLVRDAIATVMRPLSDWDNRFAIVYDLSIAETLGPG